MTVDGFTVAKIKKYIKRLKASFQKYSFEEAYNLISKQIQIDDALIPGEMSDINMEIRVRLKANWPFKDVI